MYSRTGKDKTLVPPLVEPFFLLYLTHNYTDADELFKFSSAAFMVMNDLLYTRVPHVG